MPERFARQVCGVGAVNAKELGRSGILVPPLGLGCANFGREVDEDTSFALMDYAFERGINLFDTAEAYGAGQARDYRKKYLGVDDVRETSSEYHSSEKIIGRWLRSRNVRDRIVLVTKVTTNFARSHVREALEASLERLQTDHVDVYLFHQFDANTPAEESVAAMDEAVGSARARAGGCSNYNAAQLRDALETSRRLGVRRFEVTEPIYNLVAREIEQDLLPLCRSENLGVLSYSPLAAGFLSGKYQPDRSRFPKGSRFDVIPGHADVYFNEQNFQTVARVHETASRLGVPPLRLAMAWVLRRPEITTVLVGARNTAQLDNAVEAMKLSSDPAWQPALESVAAS